MNDKLTRRHSLTREDPPDEAMLAIRKADSDYFARVFDAGFVFRVIRLLLLVRHVRTRAAELLEMPALGMPAAPGL